MVYLPLLHTYFPASWTSCEQMANAEVSIPVGDVVVVPTEGNEGGNPEDTKAQVILQLQPVQQGYVHPLHSVHIQKVKNLVICD